MVKGRARKLRTLPARQASLHRQMMKCKLLRLSKSGAQETTEKVPEYIMSVTAPNANSACAGRHAITVTPAAHNDAKFLTPRPTSTVIETFKNISRMFATYPYWDVSYLVAVIFTLGSVVWCLNGFFAWLPLQNPSTEFPGEITVGGGVTAFLGATIFEFGSILLMIEAVNENRSDCFGWALVEALEENGLMRVRQEDAACKHHHHDKHHLLGHDKASEGALNFTRAILLR
jgi:hypothetical protein